MLALIRPPEKGDAYRIAQVEIEVWRDTYPALLPSEYLVDRLDIVRIAALWARRLEERAFARCCRIAVDPDAGIVGYITFGAPRERDVSFDSEIYEVYVLTDFQNHNIGRRLCAEAANALREQGAHSLMVEVIDGNPARFFYETLGAKFSARKDRPFAGLRLPSLIYGWNDLDALLTKRSAEDGFDVAG